MRLAALGVADRVLVLGAGQPVPLGGALQIVRRASFPIACAAEVEHREVRLLLVSRHGRDRVLHGVRRDDLRVGRLIENAARRYRRGLPLALPLALLLAREPLRIRPLEACGIEKQMRRRQHHALRNHGAGPAPQRRADHTDILVRIATQVRRSRRGEGLGEIEVVDPLVVAPVEIQRLAGLDGHQLRSRRGVAGHRLVVDDQVARRQGRADQFIERVAIV